MKDNKKGQAALEFLMTYGWAILVVLAAIAALAYFGVLSPQRLVPNRCTFDSGFSCPDSKAVQATGDVQFDVQNGMGVDLDDLNVTVTPDAKICTSGPATIAVGPLPSGQTSPLLTYNCAGLASRFSAQLTLSYLASGEQLSHDVSGEIFRASE